MSKLKIGLVFGGRSGEHEVSKLSAQAVGRALNQAGFKVVPIFIDKKGRWSVKGREVILSPSPGRGLRTAGNRRIPIDVYFPVLHGTFGEDGTIQGLFELSDVPYVGAGVLGSAIGMDKEAQKRLFLYHGIPTAHFEVVDAREWAGEREAVLRRLQRSVGLPCFVKPANLGSSVGVSKVTKKDKLSPALSAAFRYDRKVLVEELIKGREIMCSVIGNDEIRVSLPGEVVPRRDFYDYVAKYVDEKTEYKVGIPLAPALHDKVMRLSAAVYRACFCQGYARVDFFLTAADELVTVEINTIPGFTGHSLFPRLWEASGLPFPALVKTLVDLGLTRWQDNRRLSRETRQGRLLA